MAIFREKTDDAKAREREMFPSIKNPDQYLPVPDFTISNDALAQMIVDAWVDRDYREALLKRESDDVTPTIGAVKLATESVNKAGFNLRRAVVISEEQYFNHYTVSSSHPDEVVFVLPDRQRVHRRPSGQTLLQTAKLLMATVPNGI